MEETKFGDETPGAARVLPRGITLPSDKERLVNDGNYSKIDHTYTNSAFVGYDGGDGEMDNGGGRVNYDSTDSLDIEPDYDPMPDYNDSPNHKAPSEKSRKLWDVFRIVPPDSGDFCGEEFWESVRRVVKVILAVFMFATVIAAAITSKLTLFLIVGYISDDNRFNCDRNNSNCVRSNSEGQWALPQNKHMVWIWAMLICVCGTYVFEFIRGVWIFCFKTVKYPKKTTIILWLVQETIRSLGIFIFVFITLPAFDVVRGLWLTFGVATIPALLKLFEKNEVEFPTEVNQSGKTRAIVFKVFDILAFVGQISVLVVWLIGDIINGSVPVAKFLLPVGLVLSSVGWWENYVTQNTSFTWMANPIRKLKKDINRGRTILTIFSSFWSIAATFIYVTVYFAMRNGDCVHVLYFQRNQAEYCFGELRNGTKIMTPSQITDEISRDPFWIALVQVLSSGLCYTLAKTACKILLQRVSFSLPLMLVTPITFLAMSGVCFQWHRIVDYFSENSFMPSSLFWHCDTHRGNASFEEFITAYSTDFYMPVVVIWWLSLCWLTWHIWRPKMERLAKTEKLFVRSLYCGVFLEQSLLLNRRRDEQHYRKLQREEHKKIVSVGTLKGIDGANPLDPSSVRTEDTPMIYICATMWHESENEMIQVLKSVVRLDEDQCARRNATTALGADDPDYYEFEAHVFFDDAFDAHSESEFNYKANGFVQMMVRVVDVAVQAVHGVVDLALKPPVKIPTPYGGRLEWTLPGGNKMVAHLKDKTKIRHKKRWSQVMYMYYFLGHQLMDVKTLKPRQKQIRAENTFLLALDGDVDFNPSAIQLLVDRMKKDSRVGAACGRIHPIGAGPMVWYQKFEYAVSHWLQKSTEHMIGCVLCSPGCFSLFRGSALMDDNVMRRYTTTATEARHFVQYDQGEDRWLCTLLLQQGYRVEYCAASDAYTYAPEGFNEYFTQRRRWTPSTMANILDLLMDWKHVIRMNENISCLYIMYQGFMMGSSIVTPGTVFLLISGAINVAFPVISLEVSLAINFLPLVIFFGLCFAGKGSTQLTFASILSVVYALVMMLVIVGLIVQVVNEGMCSLTTIFLIFVVGTFFLAAILHPQEIYCFPFGLLYFLAIPSMAMLLMIYSLCNLNVVSWGTREVKQAPKADGAPQAPAQTKPKGLMSNILSSIAKTPTTESDYALSFGNLCRCLCCPTESNKNKAALEAISDRLDFIEEHLIDIKHGRDTDSVMVPTGIISMDDAPKVFEGAGQRQNPLFEEPKQVWRDELIDPFWIHDSGLGSGQIRHLDNSEIAFWRQLQDKYLAPLPNDPDEQKRVSEELKELRNKVCLGYFLLNAIYIVTIVTLQYVQTSNGLLRINVDCYIYDPHHPLEMPIEPLSVVFMGVFGVILFIQLIAMLFHRLATFLHINAATKLGKQNDKDDTAMKIQIARQLQTLKDQDDDDDNQSVTTVDSQPKQGGKIVRRLAKRPQKSAMTQGTLRARFISNIHKVVNIIEDEKEHGEIPSRTRFRRRATSKFQHSVDLLREQKDTTERLLQILRFWKRPGIQEKNLPIARRRWLWAYRKVKKQIQDRKRDAVMKENNGRNFSTFHSEAQDVEGNPDYADDIPLGADASNAPLSYRNLRQGKTHGQSLSQSAPHREAYGEHRGRSHQNRREDRKTPGTTYMMNAGADNDPNLPATTSMLEQSNEALY